MAKRLLFCYSIFSLITIIIFRVRFHYPPTIIWGHFLFVFIIHFSFLYLSYLVFRKWLERKGVFVLYFYLYTTLWTIFYALIFMSNSNWGDTITFSILKAYTR